MPSDDPSPDSRLDVSAVHSVADIARLIRDLLRREARQRGDSPLTYRELAARTGSSRSLIARYVSGQALPQSDRFDVLVQVLGATPAELGVLATARDRVEEHRRSAASRPGGPSRSPVPRTLPAPSDPFAGRAAELLVLDAVLHEATARPAGANIVVIGGAAGAGKSALAVHWAHRAAKHFPDGQLYVNLREHGPAPVAAPIRSLLDQLRVPAERLRSSVDAQIALYRTRMAGKRLLVVLDNARYAQQVRPLLPGAPGCLVVVTGHDQLAGLVAIEGARLLSVETLSPPR